MFPAPGFDLGILARTVDGFAAAGFLLGLAEELECLAAQALGDGSEEKTYRAGDEAAASADELALGVDEVNDLFGGAIGTDAAGLVAESRNGVVVDVSVSGEGLEENGIGRRRGGLPFPKFFSI